MDPNYTLLAIAALNAITAFLAFRTHALATKTQKDVAIVEKATNSMKDQLVKATGDASFAAGKDEARIEGEQKAATLAEGKLK